MKDATLLLLAIFSLLNHVTSAEKGGYLLIVPKVLSQHSINNLEFDLYDVDGPGEVTIILSKINNDSIVYSEKTVQIEAGVCQTIIEFPVPEVEDYEANLRMNGSFQTEGDDKYEISGSDRVTFRKIPSRIIFIQTDKPIYKPGQKVLFRILLVDSSLKPLGRNTQADFWIEEPSGSRVGQWKNVSIGNGIVQREFQLTDEPILGNWKISASTDDNDVDSGFFEVKEYVLPKFEVTIKPPTFVLVTAKIIPIEICGKYTYGKLVEGQVNISISLEAYSWSFDKFPTLDFEGEIEGCYKYDINVSHIDEDLKHVYRRISVFASINETGTGISRNTTMYIDRIQNPLNMAFQTDHRQYFKPGLPYHGIVKVTKPDNTVAPEEPIELCTTIEREREIAKWWAKKKVKYCSNHTSDELGLVRFTIPPQNIDSVSMNVEAKSLRYPTTTSLQGPTMYQPQTSTYLRPWFSPSGSHIQIQNIRGSLPCGKTAEIQILYTAEDKETYKFYYQAVNGRKVPVSGNKEINFNEEDNIAGPSDDDIMIGAKEFQLVPPPSQSEKATEDDDPSDDEKNCKFIEDTKYVPMVGSFNISIAISALQSPSFHFLIYYTRKDRETVADSYQFTVEKCFNNKVSLKFGDEQKQPGTKTMLTLSSSPHSLCGIKVVDKSITLLDSSEQLTTEKIFSELERFDSGQYYSRNPCNGKKVQPGLEKRIAAGSFLPPRPPRPSSSSSYEDALTAFENSGFLVISDFILFTRPCKNNQYYESGYGGVAMPSMGIRGAAGFSAGPPAPARRPAAHKVSMTTTMSNDNLRGSSAGAEAEATKSVVDVRTFFPETWLFDLHNIGEDGTFVQKEQLPHTITEWLGSAVCINEEDGLGLSLEPAHIKGFQAFFLQFTLPYSMIRGEKLPVTVTVFNYLDKCLPISLELQQTAGFDLLSTNAQVDVCVCGGKSVSQQFLIQPTILGVLNLTASGQNIEDSDICGDRETATVVARDALTNQVLIEAEGFPFEKVTNTLFCPKDTEDDVYKRKFALELPADVVEGSERGYLSASGDIMGPAIQNLDSLVRLPTGCGEQNMVTFTPIIFVLEYLKNTNKLTDALLTKAKGYLSSGYQRELNYRRSDGSYSAFGSRDKSGSIWLTAFVVRSFAQAKPYIDIDADIQQRAIDWILSKQKPDGSFPEIGATLSHGIKGGLNASSSALTAYILTSLLVSGLKNENVTESALAFIASDDGESNAYNDALFANTFAEAGEKAAAHEYLKKALSKADSTGEETSWRIKGSNTSSVSLEIASYTILTLLKLEEPLEKILPIVRAITKARNSRGGFSSTQDTVMGLQALGEFSREMSKDPINIEMKVSDGLDATIKFDDDDKLLVKKFKTTKVPSELSIEATGTGCGIIQAIVLCNTKTAHKEELFDLRIEASRSANCKDANIKICTRYVPDGKRSNMALVEIKMISGMVADKESLQALLRDKILELKRFDVDNNMLVFYFDELTNSEKCFEFTATQMVPIGDAKPATGKVYDYYATEQKQETTYTIEDTCNAGGDSDHPTTITE